MTTFRQSKNFIKREVTLHESKFDFKISRYGTVNEYKIPYENLGGIGSYKNSHISFVFFALGFYLFAAMAYYFSLEDKTSDPDMWITWAFIGSALLVYYFINHQNLWKIKLSNGGHLFLEKNVPNKETTDEFIEKLYQVRNNYLRSTYLSVDANLNYQDQYNNMKWLHTIDVISKQEFDEKYEELKKIFMPVQRPIGFNQ